MRLNEVNMIKRLLPWAFWTLLPLPPAWAQDPFAWPMQEKSPEKKFRAAYFNGNEFEQIKSVQMIGVDRTPDNIERENQVRVILSQNVRPLQFCYERALMKSPMPLVDVTFYFVVDSEGNFKNLTADVLTMSDSINADLLACSVARFQALEAPSWNGDRTFRYKARFKTSQQ